jgi:hypothetical protein
MTIWKQYLFQVGKVLAFWKHLQISLATSINKLLEAFVFLLSGILELQSAVHSCPTLLISR